MLLYRLQFVSYQRPFKDWFWHLLHHSGYCSTVAWQDPLSRGEAHHSSTNDVEGHGWLKGTSRSPQILCMGRTVIRSHTSVKMWCVWKSSPDAEVHEGSSTPGYYCCLNLCFLYVCNHVQLYFLMGMRAVGMVRCLPSLSFKSTLVLN